MIRIESLTKRFGAVRALDGLSLEVEPGVVYGFLGPNGAGKTTTMRILSGLARADSGRAWILEREIGQPGTGVRSLVGVLPEEPAFYPWMTALEYLKDFIAPLFGMDPKAAERSAHALLEKTGLAGARNRRLQGFSRGMRQRLGLAQALIHRPPVLLLDEPVSALDPAGRKEVLNMIDGLKGDTTILLSTHILADVERVCDVVGIIDQGRLVIQDKREELLARYALPLVEVELEAGLEAWAEEAARLPCVESVSLANGVARVLVKDLPVARRELLSTVSAGSLAVRRFELVRPDLEDVFLRLTGGGAAA